MAGAARNAFTDGWENGWMNGWDPSFAPKFATILFSFLTFLLIWVVFNARPNTKRLEKSAAQQKVSFRIHKAELATRLISTVHAAFVGQGVLRVLYFDGQRLRAENNGFTETSDTAALYFCVSVAFFIGDFLICCVQFEDYGYGFLLHAICGLGTYFYVVMSDSAHYWACLGLTWEISTVFLNVRWWLLEYNHKNSLCYKINSVLVVLVFGIIRIFISWPLTFYYVRSSYRLTTLGGGNGSVSTVFFGWTSAVTVALGLLNGFWFSKMLRSIKRAICGGRKKEKTSSTKKVE